MPRILLVAATTGYQMRSFAEAARRLGIDVTLATDRCHVLEDPWRDNAIPVKFDEPEQSAEALAMLNVDGIVAVADRPTLIAALAAVKLGLPYHPPDAAAACRDKHRTRQIFDAAGLQVPRYLRIPIDADPDHACRDAAFPCVLKPLGLSASRGVIRADDRAEFPPRSRGSGAFSNGRRSAVFMMNRIARFRSRTTSKAKNSRSKD